MRKTFEQRLLDLKLDREKEKEKQIATKNWRKTFHFSTGKRDYHQYIKLYPRGPVMIVRSTPKHRTKWELYYGEMGYQAVDEEKCCAITGKTAEEVMALAEEWFLNYVRKDLDNYTKFVTQLENGKY